MINSQEPSRHTNPSIPLLSEDELAEAFAPCGSTPITMGSGLRIPSDTADLVYDDAVSETGSCELSAKDGCVDGCSCSSTKQLGGHNVGRPNGESAPLSQSCNGQDGESLKSDDRSCMCGHDNRSSERGISCVDHRSHNQEDAHIFAKAEHEPHSCADADMSNQSKSSSHGHPGGHPHMRLGGHPHGHPGGHPAHMPRQRHGGSRSRGFMPGGGAAAQAFQQRYGIKAPRIIAWEITRSCNLACAHCRASAQFEPYPGELTLDEVKATIDDICMITNPILILTGGEPLMRKDIWEIIDYAHEKGASPVVGTNGMLIDREVAQKLHDHGIPRISVSIDFPDAASHDAFRGEQGAFEKTVQGIKYAKEAGVGVQINTTVTKLNYQKLEEMHELALSLNVDAFHLFLLVPTGRGEDLRDVELTSEEYESALTWAHERQKTSPLHFKPTDAPQYYRIVHQKAVESGSKISAEDYGLDAMTRGCLGGITFVFISHTGDVQPCGYFNMQLGNVKEKPFSNIFLHSPVFNDLRNFSTQLTGKCGLCEYKAVCGGCRARALAETGDYMDQEPYCAFIPRKLRERGEHDGSISGSQALQDIVGASSGCSSCMCS